jgi:hypothetical protein
LGVRLQSTAASVPQQYDVQEDTMNITISNEMEKAVKQVAAYDGESFDFVVETLLKRAIKDKQYRTRRNAAQWEIKKAEREELKHLRELQEKINQKESE